MSNFWETEDGESIESAGNFEVGGGSLSPIPEGTSVLAVCTEAAWYTPEEYPELISLTWEVVDGEYANRKIFQKLKVNEEDTKKRDRAKRMLAAIDANAGGKLIKLGKKPEDMDLATCLTNRTMVLKLGLWEMNDKSGNWVMAVSPSDTPIDNKKPDIDEDIPF